MMPAREALTRESQVETSTTPNCVRMRLDAVAPALIVTDLSGQIRYVNMVASQMLELTSARARGLLWRECLDFIQEQTRAPIADPVCLSLTIGKAVQLGISVVLRDKKGEETPIEGFVAPLCWPHDEIIGAVMTFRGVTPTGHQRFYPVG